MAIATIGFIVAAILLELLIPKIELLTGYTLNPGLINPFQLFVFASLTFVFIVTIGGGYPSIFMSKLEPVKAIKSRINFSTKRTAFSLRKILIVLQFGISQALIIATLIVLSQLNFLKNAEMGFDKSSIVEVSLPTNDSLKIETFKNQLLNNSVIQNVSFSSTGTASNSLWRGTCNVGTGNEIKKLNPIIKFIDSRFLNTYGLNLIAGENVRDNSTEKRFLVNQEFVKQIGFNKNYDKVIGISLKIWGVEGTVCGVFKNFNATSLHDKMEPMVMTSAKKLYNQAGIKLAPGNTEKELKFVKVTWASMFPENIYDYEFLDRLIGSFYEDDAKILTFLYIFSGLAITLACLGLLGLVSFMTVNRTKEVGIRKVLGASTSSLLKLLLKDFIILVFLANIIAWPAAYYFMNRWLEDFAYRINMNISFFALTSVLLLLLAFLTISYHSIKVATANPVKSLRYE